MTERKLNIEIIGFGSLTPTVPAITATIHEGHKMRCDLCGYVWLESTADIIATFKCPRCFAREDGGIVRQRWVATARRRTQ